VRERNIPLSMHLFHTNSHDHERALRMKTRRVNRHTAEENEEHTMNKKKIKLNKIESETVKSQNLTQSEMTSSEI
jgi:hypothetical protein